MRRSSVSISANEVSVCVYVHVCMRTRMCGPGRMVVWRVLVMQGPVPPTFPIRPVCQGRASAASCSCSRTPTFDVYDLTEHGITHSSQRQIYCPVNTINLVSLT